MRGGGNGADRGHGVNAEQAVRVSLKNPHHPLDFPREKPYSIPVEQPVKRMTGEGGR